MVLKMLLISRDLSLNISDHYFVMEMDLLDGQPSQEIPKIFM